MEAWGCRQDFGGVALENIHRAVWPLVRETTLAAWRAATGSAVGAAAWHVGSPVGMRRRDAIAAASIAVLPLPALADGPASAAVAAKRFSMAPNIFPLNPLTYGAMSRFEDVLVSPKGSKNPSIPVQFDFPSQWSQLEKASGGIQFVDGNTGLKTYVLTAPLPGTSLETTPKAWFGDSIFSQQGTIVRGGTVVEEYKVSSSKMVEGSTPRRRLAIKYTVVTPANQRAVDRRAVVDCYEVDGSAFMLVASASASKWEGGEKERCERTADSFVIGS